MDTPNNQTPPNSQKPLSGATDPAPGDHVPPAASSPPDKASSPPRRQPTPNLPVLPSSSAERRETAPKSAQAQTIRPRTEDEVCWEAKDGQVRLVIKARPRRRPQSSYPVMVLLLRAKDHTRIQKLEDGQGVEALLRWEEVEQIAEAANRISMETGKGKIFEILQHLPPKDPARKQMWDRINAAYHRDQPRDGTDRCP